MDIASLRTPSVRRTLEAINQGKIEDFLALFTPDATVVDVSTYTGAQEIRNWAQRETFSVHVRFQLEAEQNEEGTIVSGQVHSSGGYNGPAIFSFTLRNNLIKQLTIE